MPSRIDWYLIELDRQIADFPEERRQILLTEVESHLREETDEMVAAGMSLAEADAEAVRVFGNPDEFAARMRTETKTPIRIENEASLRGTANVIVGTTVSLAMFGIGAAYITPPMYILFKVLMWICAFIVLLAAITSRRISLGSIALSLVMGGFVVSGILGLSLVDFGPADGIDVATVSQAQEMASAVAPGTAEPEVMPDLTHDAREALSMPLHARVSAFLRNGFFCSTVATFILLFAWMGRHALRLIRSRRGSKPTVVA